MRVYCDMVSGVAHLFQIAASIKDNVPRIRLVACLSL